MKKISIILPTRDRIKLVKRLLNSIIEHTSDLQSLEIILYVDHDDAESSAISSSVLSLYKIIGPRDTMGNMLRRCYEKSTSNYIVLLNDDAVIRTLAWDHLILEAAKRFPDDIVLMYVNDRYQGRRVPTFPILSRKTCDLIGKICPAQYKRHCIETHILDIFNRLKDLGHERILYLPHVVFEHMNYELSEFSYENKPIDDYANDQSLYFSLMQNRQVIAKKLNDAIRLSGYPRKILTGPVYLYERTHV